MCMRLCMNACILRIYVPQSLSIYICICMLCLLWQHAETPTTHIILTPGNHQCCYIALIYHYWVPSHFKVASYPN